MFPEKHYVYALEDRSKITNYLLQEKPSVLDALHLQCIPHGRKTEVIANPADFRLEHEAPWCTLG